MFATRLIVALFGIFTSSLLLTGINAQSDSCQSTTPPSYDFGTCSNPGITYSPPSASQNSGGYSPLNTNQFPHDFTTDIASLESYICSRLQSSNCKASDDAIQACETGFWNYAGLVGQAAASQWNHALGLDDQGHLLPQPANSQNANSLRVTCTVTTETITQTLSSGEMVPQTTQPHPTIPPAFGTSTAVYTLTLTTVVVSLSPGILTLFPTSTRTETSTVTELVSAGSAPTAAGGTTSDSVIVTITGTQTTDGTTVTDTATSTRTTITDTTSTRTDISVTTSTTTTVETSTTVINPNVAQTDGSPFGDASGSGAARDLGAPQVLWTLTLAGAAVAGMALLL